jgi:hypothetical protein
MAIDFILFKSLPQTAIRLDRIDLPETDLSELAYRSVRFPISPQEGYIDGSIYVRYMHNPVDVAEITFGEFYGDSLDGSAECKRRKKWTSRVINRVLW